MVCDTVFKSFIVCVYCAQEMLLDVLVYTEGPRIRDRISHSEVCGCGLGCGLTDVTTGGV